jgi:hypothetical protein
MKQFQLMSPQTSLPEKNPDPKEPPDRPDDDLFSSELLKEDFELSGDIDDIPI